MPSFDNAPTQFFPPPRLRLNIDVNLLPADRRTPEDVFMWYQPPPRHLPSSSDFVHSIVADLGLTRDPKDITLRVDGYAVKGDEVLRENDVVHVCFRNDAAALTGGTADIATSVYEHGGPWPLSPAAPAYLPGYTETAPNTAPADTRKFSRLGDG